MKTVYLGGTEFVTGNRVSGFPFCRCRSPHYKHRTRRVIHHLVCRGAEEPAPDSRMAAVADDQQVGADLKRVLP
jgi:hypothetical protein